MPRRAHPALLAELDAAACALGLLAAIAAPMLSSCSAHEQTASAATRSPDARPSSNQPRAAVGEAPPEPAYVPEEQFTGRPPPEHDPTFPNWPVRPILDLEAARFFDGAPIEIVRARHSGAGTTGAERVDILLPTIGHECRLKVKRFPRRLDGFNNSPRKEIAAYMIQRLFLDPADYVVPTTLPRCVPITAWRPHHPGDGPTLPGTDCVLVTTALWLRDVTLPDPLLDVRRFETDATYARRLADFNLLTYLIDHRDGRRGNFLVSTDDGDRHVFAVDNGISFGPWVYNYFVPNWHKLRVPALRRESLERLARLEREDLDFLAVAVQLEADTAGVLRLTKPSAAHDPDRGATVTDRTVQLGLTRRELDAVWRRIERLVADVDAGRRQVF